MLVIAFKFKKQRYFKVQDGYFLCLLLPASVIMAHSMMTKVNKSEYLAIIPLLSVRSRNGWYDRPIGFLGKYFYRTQVGRNLQIFPQPIMI